MHAFDSAGDYESHAHIQRTVAERLAKRIAALDIDILAPALEIGCGTGFLTAALLDTWPGLPLTASDIAPAMIERTRRLLGERDTVSYAILDGERLDARNDHFGLITSSLAFQWFEDPVDAINHMIASLKPGGWLAFSTLVAGSFREWISAQKEAGVEGLTRAYPVPSLFEAIAPGQCDIFTKCYSLTETHADGLSFLRGLKAIGAGTRWIETKPSRTGDLRKAIDLFERQGASISYEIAEIAIRRKI